MKNAVNMNHLELQEANLLRGLVKRVISFHEQIFL